MKIKFPFIVSNVKKWRHHIELPTFSLDYYNKECQSVKELTIQRQTNRQTSIFGWFIDKFFDLYDNSSNPFKAQATISLGHCVSHKRTNATRLRDSISRFEEERVNFQFAWIRRRKRRNRRRKENISLFF